MDVHIREWGSGDPVIALHPLGLESSGFAGFGRALARHGFRTIAIDLPGFGKSPPGSEPLRPDVLARPVIELARSLAVKPYVLGISLGGRVAIEAALLDPNAFRAVIPIAPYLPWLRFRGAMQWGWLLDPSMADWMPLERLWPLMLWLSKQLEQMPTLRDDELAQAGMRLVYYMACPATRRSFLSATRELALDPAFGPDGLWSRLPNIQVPATFIWGERDWLISSRFAEKIAEVLPETPQLMLPCAGHWWNGPHHLCLAETVATVLTTKPEDLDESEVVRCRKPAQPTWWSPTNITNLLCTRATPTVARAPEPRRAASAKRRKSA